MELELDKLYCNTQLEILAKMPGYGYFNSTFNIRVGKQWVSQVSADNSYIEIDNEYQTISSNNTSFITDIFELQTKLDCEMFIRSTASLKKNINDGDWILDKYNILKVKSANTPIITIAIHKISNRDKIIDAHNKLYIVLNK